MAARKRTCGECGGAAKAFGPEDFIVEHQGHSVVARELSGWRCAACGEVEFDADSAVRYAATGDSLVLGARQRVADEIKRIRTALGLTQVEAARIAGGGPNAFSRYERGETKPMPAVLHLFRLLSKHPELLKEIRS